MHLRAAGRGREVTGSRGCELWVLPTDSHGGACVTAPGSCLADPPGPEDHDWDS